MRIHLLPFVVLLAACSSYRIAAVSPPPFDTAAPPPPGVGEVCVVRPTVVGGLVPIVVHDNGQLVGATRGPTYFCYFAEPGAHHIVAKGGDDIDEKLGTTQDDKADVTIEAGARYFLRQNAANTLGLAPLQWVDEPTGRKMMAECTFTVLEAVPGSEALPGRAPLARAIR